MTEAQDMGAPKAEALDPKAAEYYDQLLRLRAEFENYRRRVEKEKVEARRWGKEEVVLRLVSVMDVMEQAEAAAHKTSDAKSVLQGLDMVYGEFKRLLKEEGLEEVPAKAGEGYNHETQEAVETVESEDAPGKIVAVIQKGYRFQGNLFRPARVKVSAEKSQKLPPEDRDPPTDLKIEEGSPD